MRWRRSVHEWLRLTPRPLDSQNSLPTISALCCCTDSSTSKIGKAASNSLRKSLRKAGIRPAIPGRSNRKKRMGHDKQAWKGRESLSAATVGSTDSCWSDGALGVCRSPFSAAGAAVRDALAAGRAAGCEQDRSRWHSAFSIRAENPPSTGFPAALLGRRAGRC
jgi:hypothetical protein